MKYTHIFLIGFMGAGKSTYGRELVETLGWSFADSDNWIEGKSGKSIPEIFEQDGEESFRQWESKALEAAMQHTNVVIATGGGLPVNPVHQEQMRSKGLVVWLNTPWETILGRLQTLKDRPLIDISVLDWETNLQKLYESRLPFYRCAHVIIDPLQWDAKRFAKWLLQ